MKRVISYEGALNEVLCGCFPEREHVTGATPEYTRGVLNALAEMFATPGVHTSDRMAEILADLTRMSDDPRTDESQAAQREADADESASGWLDEHGNNRAGTWGEGT